LAGGDVYKHGHSHLSDYISKVIKNMFDQIKQLLVERTVECPNCDEVISAGAFMYIDEYRNEYCCPYCIKDYKEAVLREEGEHGELLK
jgi:hypothetical protein